MAISGASPQPSTPRRGIPRWLRVTGQALFPLSMIALALLRLFVFQLVLVRQSSMLPTLHENDRLLINMWQVEEHMPTAGTVMVLRHPYDGFWVVKRVIGLPGDTIGFTEHAVVRNGRALIEPYAAPARYAPRPVVTVPADSVYVLGDNRPDSEDSRDYGPVPAENWVGRAVSVVLPLEHRGDVPVRAPEPGPPAQPIRPEDVMRRMVW